MSFMSQTPKIALFSSLVLAAFCFGCRSTPPGMAAPSRHSARTFLPADQANSPLLPDPKMTPGATLPVATGDICVSGYSKKVRNVPNDVKEQVYAEYGITSHKPGEYEVDHLISLELGGSNSIKNLWPQSYVTQPWNAHVKDKLENELHNEVCSGKIDLPTAQHEIATDWIASYKKHFHTNLPLSSGSRASSTGHARRYSRHPLTGAPIPFTVPAASSSAAEAGTAGNQSLGAQALGAQALGAQVWVNLNSGKYFQPGSKYYGHTKSGQYMSEAAAQKQGYVAARGQ
jgi:hypothetical protein